VPDQTHPLVGGPTLDEWGAPWQTFSFTPEDAETTVIFGVLNDDGTFRAVDAQSSARQIDGEVERAFAQLEAVMIWSDLGRVANPRLTQTEADAILTDLGLPVGKGSRFGHNPSLVLERKGALYYVVEGEATTDFVIRPSSSPAASQVVPKASTVPTPTRRQSLRRRQKPRPASKSAATVTKAAALPTELRGRS
jgi:hypothetical protein